MTDLKEKQYGRFLEYMLCSKLNIGNMLIIMDMSKRRKEIKKIHLKIIMKDNRKGGS